MALLTLPEFSDAIEALAAHYGVQRLRDRLASLGAFASRKGLNSAAALSDRLYRLSGGLRIPGHTTQAFTAVWGEMLGSKLGEEGEKKLGDLADKVNACLTEKETIVEGKEQELDEALAAYREALAEGTGADVARIDMLLKAVPSVADRLRAAPSGAVSPT